MNNTLIIHETQIIELEEKLIEAIQYGNIDFLNMLLHNNLVFIIPTGEVINKLTDINNYKTGVMKVLDIVVQERIINLHDTIANVVSTVYLKIVYAGEIIEGNFRYLRVWKLNENSWQVIAGSSIQI